MSDCGSDKLARLQAVLTALLKHQLGESLERVERSLQRWRGGDVGPFEAHAEVLKHAARAERMAARIAQVGPGGVGASVLRDAYDLGLLDGDELETLAGKPPADIEPSPPLDEDEMPMLPDKREFVGQLLEEGPVLVHLDARRDDVSVPARFCGDPKLVLRFGFGLSPAIVDLCVDEQGMSGTLTFGGVPHHCVIPWTALYAAVAEADHRGMVWPDDVPAEVLEQMSLDGKADGDEATSDSSAASEETPPSKRPGCHLKLVE